MRIELAGKRPIARPEFRIRATGEVAQLVIDAERLEFASPLDLAAMVAIAHSASGSVVVVPPADPSVASYLERMDVFAQLPAGARINGNKVIDQPRRDRSGVLIEVSALSSRNVDGLVNRVGAMVSAHLHQTVSRLVFQGIGELIDNAVSHGESPLGAFICAQTYSGRTSNHRGVEFAVCDTGIGVLAHLRRNREYENLSRAHVALSRAIEPGVSGTGDPRGYGLHDLLETVGATGQARLLLRSGEGIASVVVRQRQRRQHTAPSPGFVHGTWAWLRVRYP